MRLDTKTIGSLQLGDKLDQIFFDDELPRFGLRLRKTSDGKVSRNWVVQYRQDGRQRRHKLGSADVVSAEQARKAAKTILAKVQLGDDPQGEKANRREKDAYAQLKREVIRLKAERVPSRRPPVTLLGGPIGNTRRIEGMYREPRGSITHPHRDETITLGRLIVRRRVEQRRQIENGRRLPSDDCRCCSNLSVPESDRVFSPSR